MIEKVKKNSNIVDDGGYPHQVGEQNLTMPHQLVTVRQISIMQIDNLWQRARHRIAV